MTGFVTLSNERSALWRNQGQLASDVLQQYPGNMRALTLVQGEALRNGNPKVVLELVTFADEQLLEHEHRNSGSAIRKHDSGRVYQHYAVVQQFSTYAIAQLQGVDAALEYADQVIEVMD